MTFRFPIVALVLAGMSGCGPSYSPDTYASNAAQQANKVEQGVVVGVRNVAVSAAGTVGTVTGAAAGGIAGSQVAAGPTAAFTALGGSLVGGIAGSTVEHVTADTQAFEYIVRKPNGDLVSVTQKDKTPLALGQNVLVIAGAQARVVPDYTVPPATLPKDATKSAATAADSKSSDAKSPDAKPTDAKPGDAKPADTSSAPAAPAAQPEATATQAASPPTVFVSPKASGDAKPTMLVPDDKSATTPKAPGASP